VRYYDAARGYCGPESAGEERDRFSICLATTDGGLYHAGDHEAPFALQSLSKVFVYGLALADRGRDRVLERVGVEPSGILAVVPGKGASACSHRAWTPTATASEGPGCVARCPSAVACTSSPPTARTPCSAAGSQ
jgi:hypothetical protein